MFVIFVNESHCYCAVLDFSRRVVSWVCFFEINQFDMKNFLQWLLVLSVFTFSSCGLFKKNEEAPQKPQLKVLRLQPKTSTFDVSYPATLRGIQDIAIIPQISGTLQKIMVKEGQRVSRGQLLFVIDQVPYLAKVQAATASLEVAQAVVAKSQMAHDSRKTLMERGVISKYQYDQAANDLMAAKAQETEARATLLAARNDLSYTEIKSPVDGVVGTLPYKVGTLVGPTITSPLTIVSDNSIIYAQFSITEWEYLKVLDLYGSKETLLNTLPDVELAFAENIDFKTKGRIETISGVIDPLTGCFSVRAAFRNEKRILSSGGSANVVLNIDVDSTYVVPRTAVKDIQDKSFVYKVVDGKIVSQQVDIRRLNGGKDYAIFEGIQPNDLVAESSNKLFDGMEVEPVE